jgi:glucose-6-phosphate 1-dehydrogenase
VSTTAPSTAPQVVDDNPLSEGLERLPVHPTNLAIFGATGDLSNRKLLPALYNLAHEGALPERFNLVGISRSEMTDDEFRAMATEAVRKYSRREPDDAVLTRLFENARYVAGTFDQSDLYAGLEKAMQAFDEEAHQRLNRCFYLSTAPAFFPVIVGKLGEQGLHGLEGADVRVIIEKPFGTTLEEAEDLNRQVL